MKAATSSINGKAAMNHSTGIAALNHPTRKAALNHSTGNAAMNQPAGMRTWKTSAGRTQTEVLAVFLLLLLLGVGVFSLASAGSAAYRRTDTLRTAQGEVRTAISYLQMKIRQADAAGAFRIEPNPVNGQNALVITEQFDTGRFETWVYHDDGALREALVPAGEPAGNEMAFSVAALEGFELSANEAGTALVIRAWSRDGRDRVVRSQTSMAIRGGGVR